MINIVPGLIVVEAGTFNKAQLLSLHVLADNPPFVVLHLLGNPAPDSIHVLVVAYKNVIALFHLLRIFATPGTPFPEALQVILSQASLLKVGIGIRSE